MQSIDFTPLGPLIDPADHDRFEAVDRHPFQFRHALHRLQAFTLDDLIDLGRRLPDGPAFKAWQNGLVGVGDGWDTRPGELLPFETTIEGIAENNSLAVLKHVEQDPVFGPVLQALLHDIFGLSPQRFRDDVLIGECLIFINSPGRTTPYHFDLEPSFLLQIAGEKQVSAWPNGDRTLVPESELEEYCGIGNLSAGRYKPERQAEAFVARLLPGDAIHFPSTGPHWVQNGADVAISVNVNFDMRSLHRSRRYTYAVNARMRKVGLTPRDPGVFPLGDAIKANAWRAARETNKAMRRVFGAMRSGEDYPVWRPDR